MKGGGLNELEPGREICYGPPLHRRGESTTSTLCPVGQDAMDSSSTGAAEYGKLCTMQAGLRSKEKTEKNGKKVHFLDQTSFEHKKADKLEKNEGLGTPKFEQKRKKLPLDQRGASRQVKYHDNEILGPQIKTISEHEISYFNKYDSNSLDIDIASKCPSCKTCGCANKTEGIYKKLESSLMKDRVYYDEKTKRMTVEYLHKSDAMLGDMINNRVIALSQAKSTYSRLQKLPLQDQLSFNANLSKALEIGAIQSWDKLTKEYPQLTSMRSRYVIGGFCYSGKVKSTKLRPIWNSSANFSANDISANSSWLQGGSTNALMSCFTYLRCFSQVGIADLEKAFYYINTSLQNCALRKIWLPLSNGKLHFGNCTKVGNYNQISASNPAANGTSDCTHNNLVTYSKDMADNPAASSDNDCTHRNATYPKCSASNPAHSSTNDCTCTKVTYSECIDVNPASSHTDLPSDCITGSASSHKRITVVNNPTDYNRVYDNDQVGRANLLQDNNNTGGQNPPDSKKINKFNLIKSRTQIERGGSTDSPPPGLN